MIKRHKCHGAFVSCVDAFRAKVKLCMMLWLQRVRKAVESIGHAEKTGIRCRQAFKNKQSLRSENMY